MISALVTKAKKPSVIIVSGRPKRLRTGFTIRFKSPKTTAKIMAVENPSKCTPGKIFVSKNATTAVMSNRIMKFMIYFFNVMLSVNKCHSKSMGTLMNCTIFNY